MCAKSARQVKIPFSNGRILEDESPSCKNLQAPVDCRQISTNLLRRCSEFPLTFGQSRACDEIGFIAETVVDSSESSLFYCCWRFRPRRAGCGGPQGSPTQPRCQ